MSALKQHTVIVTSNVQDARNTSSHFYNVLGKSMDLSQGHWKVAIKKIIYLNSFLNIIDESISVATRKRGTITITDFSKYEMGQYQRNVPVNGPENFQITQYFDVSGKPSILEVKINCDASKAKLQEPIIKIHATDKDGNKNLVEDSSHHTAQYEFRNIESGTTRYYHSFGSRDIPEDTEKVEIEWEAVDVSECSIPTGRYPTVKDLTKVINQLPIRNVKFHVEAGRVKVQLPEHVKWVRMNNDLNLTLGFNEQQIFKLSSATHMPQLNRGRFAFFIYSNLVHNVRVGDMEVPLMDVISIPKQEFAEIVSLDVVNPLYSDVSLKQVHEIEILLASDSGEVIKFNNSIGNAKTLLVLHFMQTI